MPITRSTGASKTWIFDLGVRASSEPAVFPASAVNSAGANNFIGNSINASRSLFIGGSLPEYYFGPPILGASPAANAIFFGLPTPSEGPILSSTYNTYLPAVFPIIHKSATQVVNASFIMRLPQVTNATVGVNPILQWALTGVSITGNSAFASNILFTQSGTAHTTGTPGSFSMTFQAPSGSTITAVSGSVTGDTEYPCTIQINADGTGTATICGLTQTFSFQYPSGAFTISLYHGSTTQANMAGIRNMRITVG